MRIVSLRGAMLSGKSYIRNKFVRDDVAHWDVYDLYTKYNCIVDGQIDWSTYRQIDINHELNQFLDSNLDKKICIIEHIINKSVISILSKRPEEVIEIALKFPPDSVMKVRARERAVDLETAYKLQDLFSESKMYLYSQEEAIQIINGLLSDEEEAMGNQRTKDV